MTKSYAHLIIRWRWLILLLTFLLIFAMASGARFLGFTGDYHVFFSDDNPQMLAFEKLEKTYSKDDNVLFVLEPKDGNVFTPSTLAAVERITEMGWQVPYSSRVDSLSNFQYTHAEDDDLIVENLVEGATGLTSQQLDKIKRVALNEPMLLNRSVSADGRVTGINVTVQLPGKRLELEMPKVVMHVDKMVATIRADYPDINLYMTGMVPLNNAFFSSSQKDMSTLVPLTFLIVIISAGLLLKGWTGTFATFWIIIFSIASGMGFAGWMGIKLTPPSAIAPTVILTLAVANAIHVLVTMFHHMREGFTKQESIVESLRVNMQPVFITTLSTVVGFLCMNFSESPPFHDLGNMVAVGMATSFFLSISFLPALMSVLPVRKPKQIESNHVSAMDKLAIFVINKRSQLLWGGAVVVIVLASFLPRNELGENFVEYFDKSIPFRADSDFVTKTLGGMYRIDYSLDTKEAGGISDPLFLRKVDKFSKWFERQPEVIHVNSITDTMKRLNKNMHADDERYYKLPENRNLSAQYLLLYEMSLPYGLDLNNQINVNKSATRISVTIKNISTPEILELENRAQGWLANNAPELKTEGTSTTIMFSHIGKRNIVSMIQGTTIALFLVSLILIVALRSLKIGLISLVPNLVPAAMAFGLWGLLVGEVNVGLSIVTGMTLGIVVDDTVHFLSKYLRARREKNLSSEDAVRYAFATVGTALWFTSLILIAGFLILTLSTFKLNSDMGLLTSVVITFALLADFLFLPPLLMKLSGDKKTVEVNDTINDPVVSHV